MPSNIIFLFLICLDYSVCTLHLAAVLILVLVSEGIRFEFSFQGFDFPVDDLCIVCFTDKGQATLSLGMDLNLDWMTLDDFQKHLNGEDEILSGPPLSPSEYFLVNQTLKTTS